LDALRYSAVAQAGHHKIPALHPLVAHRDVCGKTEPSVLKLGTLASIFGHASLLSVVLLSVSHHVPRSELVPIAIQFSGQEENHTSESCSTWVSSQGKLSLDLPQKDVDIAQTAPSANDPISAGHGAHSVPVASFSASGGSPAAAEKY